MKVGMLTGGGDCPGLNAVIRAVVRKISNAGGQCLGLLEGWRGLVDELSYNEKGNEVRLVKFCPPRAQAPPLRARPSASKPAGACDRC